MSAEARHERSAEERRMERRRIAALWVGVLGPALAWSVQLVAGDALTEIGCEQGMGAGVVRGAVIVLTIATAAVALLTGIAGYRQRSGADGGARGERTAFLSKLGAASCAIFLVLIFGGGLLPQLFLDTCGG
jgi:hypothetical protein